MRQQAKTILTTTLIFTLLMVIIFGGVFVLQAGRAQGSSRQGLLLDDPSRTITVSGTGRISGIPDIGIINLDVQTSAETAQESLAQNHQKTQALLNALNDAGVQSEDIQTSLVFLHPKYRNSAGENQGEQNLLGYTALNRVEVKVSNLENLGSLIDKVVQASEITVNDIRFEISNSSESIDRAREAAILDARQKAERLASLTGAELGEVVTIKESATDLEQMQNDEQTVAEEADIPVEPGNVSLDIQLQVTWLLIEDQSAETSEQGNELSAETNER